MARYKAYLGSTLANRTYNGSVIGKAEGVGDIINELKEEGTFFYDISDANSYTSGSASITTLTSNAFSLSLLDGQGTGIEYKTTGSIKYLQNNWNNEGGYTLSDLNSIRNGNTSQFIDQDFSATGFSQNYWILPAINREGALSKSQEIFRTGTGTSNTWYMSLDVPSGGNATYYTGVSNKNDTTANDEGSYQFGTTADFISEWRLISMVWDIPGQNVYMYIDGQEVQSYASTETWNNATPVIDVQCFGCGGTGNAKYNLGGIAAGNGIAKVLSANDILRYYNKTKAFYGR